MESNLQKSHQKREFIEDRKMYFNSFGPFYIHKDFPNGWRSEFWNRIEKREEGLSTAIGCYVFCLKHGKKTLPWYVGKTVANNGFRDEVFEIKHKIPLYRQFIKKFSYHRPSILLFPLLTETKWAFSKNRSEGGSTITWLEKTLIGMALARNPEIANIATTKLHRKVYVNGVLGKQFQGPPSLDAQFARSVFHS